MKALQKDLMVQHLLQKNYLINFTITRKKLCLSLHYDRANSYFFVNGTEIIKSKANDSEVNAIPLYLENVSKGFSVDNIKGKQIN